MPIYIYKDNQQYGPYEESQIQQWLQNGQCSPNDLARLEGVNEWKSLGVILQLGSYQDKPNSTPPSKINQESVSRAFENEVALLERYCDEIEGLIEKFLDSDPSQRGRTQKQLEQTLGSFWRQIHSFKTAFPITEEWRSFEATFYIGQATLKAFSVGFFRKTSGRSGNLAVGIATGLVAKQQEKNNAMQALQLLDKSLSIEDSPHPRIMKAQVYCALNQKQNALIELNYIIEKFQDSSTYLDARRMKDEIENPAKTGPCFVATAVYGSPLASEVAVFRQFRDEILLHSKAGMALVNFYYFFSPPFARLISETSFLKFLVRKFLLNPLLKGLKTYFDV